MLQSWLKNFPFSYNLKKQKKYISSEIVKTLSEQKESAFILLKEARVPAEIIKILAEKCMNSSLSQWQKMEQSEKSVFYTEHLLPFIVEKYELDTIPEEIIEPDVLVSTVGTSIEPICLTYSLLRPKHLVLLHTKTTVEQADQIFDLFRLRPSIAKAHEIDETSPHRFYQKIKDIRKELKNDSKIVIDLTGGQKTMSAMAAMAGTVINGKLVYVRSERDKKAGFQIPGSERLEIIRNPYSLQGDQYIEEMISLFNSRQFKSCEMICNQIAERLDGDDRFRLLAVLAKGMFHRNNLDLSDALDFFEAFIKKSEEKECLNRYALNLKLMVKFLEPMSVVDRGSDIINHIIVSKSNEEAILPGIIFVFNLYSLAIEELKINSSPDTASLLFYRTFELFIQIVFAFEYKTKTKALKYSKLPLNEKEITDRVIGYYSKIYGVTNKKKNLSYDVGLLEGAAILKALDTWGLFKEEDSLTKVKQFTESRNNSKFAHGLVPITIEEAEEMSKTIKNMLLYKIPENIISGRKITEFLTQSSFVEITKQDFL